MKQIMCLLFILSLCGCAKVNLATSKPLKVDINMRVDLYQHVAKDVESIEDQVYGSNKKQLNAISLIDTVYAQEPSLELGTAIQNRKNRSAKVDEYLKQGYIGENKDAYLSIVANNAPSDAQPLVSEENTDRATIYKATAQKNNTDLASVQKVFFDDHYKRASSGYFFEVCDSGKCEWKKK